MTKEHVFPKWLIIRTNTHKTGIRWGMKKKVPALSATLPLCKECNKAFGDKLEKPVSKIFDDLEARKGISDNEAELLIRWLWKIDGLFWIALHPTDDYSPVYTLRERVLRPLDAIRDQLALAISLIENIDPSHRDKPLGLDSGVRELDGIFVAGVFSEVAMMVLLKDFAYMVPQHFSLYELASTKDASDDAKLFHPKVGFKDDNEAVFFTKLSSEELAKAHEILARLGTYQIYIDAAVF
jgi:hypothetical protein